MPKKPPLPLVIGVAFSILAVMLLNLYLSTERKTMEQRLKRVFSDQYKTLSSVMVASHDIAKGTEIDPSLLETKIIPNQYVEPQAVTSVDRISGLKAAVRISRGEQVTLSKLITQRQAMGRSLAMATPVGKRAITITVDTLTGLGGMIMPGDYVDVIVLLPTPMRSPDGTTTTQTLTVPLFQNVLVLAVGTELLQGRGQEEGGAAWRWGAKRSRSSKQQKSSPLITLALAPQEASLLSFVKEQGRVQLTLRSPADSEKKPVPPASWDTLFHYMNSFLPQQPKPTRRDDVEIEKPREVEVYKGLEREYMTISK